MSKINELKQIIEDAENSLIHAQRELKKLEEKQKQDKLHLKVDGDGDLAITYKDDFVGFISNTGGCYLITNIDLYEQWREDGMLVDNSVVEWRGGKYNINDDFDLARVDIQSGDIFNINTVHIYANCEDTNIKRYKHNNRPISY